MTDTEAIISLGQQNRELDEQNRTLAVKLKRRSNQVAELKQLLDAYDIAVPLVLDDPEVARTPSRNVLNHFHRAAQEYASTIAPLPEVQP